AEALEQADRRLEHTPGRADVLAQEHHALVALHFLRDAGRDRIAIGQFRHAEPPSAHTSLWISSSGGGGDAFAASVASSTRRSVSTSIARSSCSAKPRPSMRSR